MAERFYSENTDLDGEVHFLGKPDRYVERVLCFPRSTCSELVDRVSRLIDDGFIYLLETGSRKLDLRVLGKGYSSIIVVARHTSRGIGSLKILRLDSRRSSLLREAELMLMASETNLPPRLYLTGEFYVFYELLPPHRCKPYTSILRALVESRDMARVKRLLEDTLDMLFKLDVLGVDHTELNRLNGHVFYCENGVKILDWESARISTKPVNVSSFISYILFRFKLAGDLRSLLGFDIDSVLSKLRVYKKDYSEKSFNELKYELSLD